MYKQDVTSEASRLALLLHEATADDAQLAQSMVGELRSNDVTSRISELLGPTKLKQSELESLSLFKSWRVACG
eukprot:2815272-Amphidinium_carterae.1